MRDARIDPGIWRRPDMLAALGSRNIGTVYRLLQRVGVSQRRIAAMTGQSQSEISEILSGRRVVAYDVLTRIADGLKVPRGLLGLAHEVTPPKVTAPDLVPPLRPLLDAESGNWVVRVPVYVDSYTAAMSLCESLTAPPPLTRPPGKESPADLRARSAAASEAIARRWHLAARAVLRARELRAAG